MEDKPGVFLFLTSFFKLSYKKHTSTGQACLLSTKNQCLCWSSQKEPLTSGATDGVTVANESQQHQAYCCLNTPQPLKYNNNNNNLKKKSEMRNINVRKQQWSVVFLLHVRQLRHKQAWGSFALLPNRIIFT